MSIDIDIGCLAFTKPMCEPLKGQKEAQMTSRNLLPTSTIQALDTANGAMMTLECTQPYQYKLFGDFTLPHYPKYADEEGYSRFAHFEM